MFDGQWLIEKRPDKKQFVAREIAAPGEDFDPLSIKEGIMPIPIGQRAADVLERFDVEQFVADLDRWRLERDGVIQRGSDLDNREDEV